MQEDQLKQRDDYRAFMAIKDKADAADFWYEHIPDAMNKAYFTPRDYMWHAMPVRARLLEHYAKRWTLAPIDKNLSPDSIQYRCKGVINFLWTLAVLPLMLLEYKKIAKNAHLVIWVDIDAMLDNDNDVFGKWLRNRYTLPEQRCLLLPDRFASSQEEVPEDWDLMDNLAIIEEQEANGKTDYKVLYYWKKVEPAGEDPADGRRHVILMDRATHKEAPLQPGQTPYREGQ